MKKECFKEVVFPANLGSHPANLETLARMRSTKTAIVFQGRKRYAEAEEEE